MPKIKNTERCGSPKPKQNEHHSLGTERKRGGSREERRAT